MTDTSDEALAPDAEITPIDRFDGRRAASAPGLLAEFSAAGVISAADVHAAQRLAVFCSEEDERAILAAALAVRAPRVAQVFIDLASIRETIVVEQAEDDSLEALPWPEPTAWVQATRASSMVAVDEEQARLPLRLEGTHLYLDRYWREECQVAKDLLALGREANVDASAITEDLHRLFPGETTGRQAMAAATAYLRHLTVIAGGPGTGKTTTVARILALLLGRTEQDGERTPMVGLAAPTGKAAARLTEAIHEEAERLDVTDSVRAHLVDLEAMTLHRLFGWKAGSHSRFRHDRTQRLPHDIVIVDEASMVSLPQMARLMEAVRPDARLVLVGDPDQLASVEAGAVLGDIVGSATPEGLVIGERASRRLPETVGKDPPPSSDHNNPVADGVVVLKESHRFGSAIGDFAEAIRRGDPDHVVDLLAQPSEEIAWTDVDCQAGADGDLGPIRDAIMPSSRRMVESALAGDAAAALDALTEAKLLCAHREGPYGAAAWGRRLESWVAEVVPGFTPRGDRYIGRPLLITNNDYELGLFNGDLGIIVAGADGPLACFVKSGSGGEAVALLPERLGRHETVYAMTIHKAQGSQFESVAVIVPPATSPSTSRQLLYTSVTRARSAVSVVGTADAIRSAVMRPIDRASGLGPRLRRSF
ncbi:exodeoxyribonuclease V subunit alpha [Thermoleophilia bacterium SCSIO 60948]|nr:exodeoxyribonuclease V subunit alpha [Thermoleophilia bacterium SCSIO 60948]